MALISRSRVLTRFPSLWIDPDTSKNRVFIDTYAYDYTTLAPRTLEQFMWQNRANLYNTSLTGTDDYTPMQTGYMDGNCWASGNNDAYSLPGIYELWSISLDYQNYRPTRNWKTALNRIMLQYPRTSDTNQQYGDWWMGFDMAKKSMSWRHQDANYYVHLFEQVENIDFNATSWSFSTTTITVTKTSHGLFVGDLVTISGATATTNPPNGTWGVVSSADANTFTFVVPQAPTGTAGGTMRVQATVYRGWGLQHEGRRAAYASSGMTFDVIQGYNYNYGDNDSTAPAGYRAQAGAISKPYTLQGTISGGWKYFIGKDTTNTFAWVVHVDTINTHGYSIRKHALTNGTNTETVVLAATSPAGVLQNVLIPTPSNLRTDSDSRKIFYSSHYNATVLAPMRFVVNMEGGTAAATQCVLTYPSGTTFSTYAALPTANSFDAFGYNAYWAKPYQFTIGGTTYLTFCQSDKYYYANTARFPTRLARTWLTFSVGVGTNDQNLTFHSALTFETGSDFPLSWMPYGNTAEKILITSTANTSVWEFNPLSFVADSWNYSVNGTVAQVTVTAPAHGLVPGTHITISGTTASTNAPNGNYSILTVPDANTFTFNVDAINTGLPTGTAGGIVNISLGWQSKFGTSLRARGFAVDNQNRIWVGVRTLGIGTVEIHMVKEDIPFKATIEFQNSVQNNNSIFEYNGSATNTNILVNTYNYLGARIATKINLIIKSNNMTFAGNSKTIQISTSSTGSTVIPVTITGPGQALISTTAAV
jgi:hypothetical protein